ncbi:transcription factor S-II, central domain-containing protein [Lentinula edodes]|nr:transcription factor S-II, central domain-containing protein [Lentinula edodes]
MSDAAELKKLVKQLQGASNVLDIVNILSILKRDHQVNEAILRESKAGLAVGKLRAHESPEVSGAAKELVKKWKTEVEKAKQATASSQTAKPHAPRKASTASNGAITPTATANKIARTAKSDGVKVTGTGDGTRDKCAELLYDGLACDSGAPTELILQRAKAVEVAVLNNIGSTSAAYKSKIRSLFVNLKDKGNPSLREDVVSGDISAERLAKMTPGDMASAERKAADDKIKQNNLFASLGAEEQQAETDAFQCGRCKQRKCRYRQAQTRSADEPMTTFVTCVNCGNRWKFS